ncbi:MAG: MCE family protein [Deltaproteobacteria bacterium]|nr:MCE family protein [Deltaproteobacteria bacterium]
MESPKYQTLLGFVGIIAFVFLGFYVFGTGDAISSTGIPIYVDFNRSGTIQMGSDVKCGHLKIGIVEGVYLKNEKGKLKTRVKLWIKKEWAERIPVNSRVYFESVSIIGFRHINIVMPDDRSPLGRPLKAGDIMKGEDPSRIDRILKLAYETVQKQMKIYASLAPETAGLLLSVKKMKWINTLFSTENRLILAEAFSTAGNMKLTPGAKFVASNARDINLLWRIWVLDGYIRKKAAEALQKVELIESHIDSLNIKNLKTKVMMTKNNLNTLKSELRTLMDESEKVSKILSKSNGALAAIISDREIFDDLRQMAKRLKNAIIDIVFKRSEKRLH